MVWRFDIFDIYIHRFDDLTITQFKSFFDKVDYTDIEPVMVSYREVLWIYSVTLWTTESVQQMAAAVLVQEGTYVCSTLANYTEVLKKLLL